MTPTFLQLPELLVVGLGAKFISILSPQKNNNLIIPQLWHDFIQIQPSIPNQIPRASYGLIEHLPPNTQSPPSHPHEMFYLACVPVSKLPGADASTTLPKNLLHRTIPAGRYAAFIHKGKLDTLQKTMTYIYQTWLPQSAIPLRPAPHLERYDHRFNPNSDQSEFDILLPIAAA